MTKILQISDTHIVPEGELAYEQVDTARALAATVETINRLQPQVGPIDMVVVTGDLTEHGTLEEYRRFRDIMAGLDIPYRAVPGNHDRREVMREAFSDCHWMPENGPVDWLMELDALAVIGLDTLTDGMPHGSIQERTAAFLSGRLKALDGKPVLIGLHHPPFACGIAAMDAQNLKDPGLLEQAIRNYGAEVRLVCGHLHRSISGVFGGRVCQVCPGTSHAVTLDQRVTAENSLTLEPGGFLLHEMRGNTLLSHWIPVGRFDGPYPFLGV